MALPNPGMSFTPFDPLPASDLNDLVENIEALYDHSAWPTGTVLRMLQTDYSAVATSAGISIPFDDTNPQSNEGDEYMSISITPIATTSVLLVEALFMGANAGANDIIVALFRDAGASALAADAVYQATANGGVNVRISVKVTAGSTSSTTFKLRAGVSGAGTTTFNGTSSARKFGAIPKSWIRVTETKA